MWPLIYSLSIKIFGDCNEGNIRHYCLEGKIDENEIQFVVKIVFVCFIMDENQEVSNET
jgi:hypothetical protein